MLVSLVLLLGCLGTSFASLTVGMSGSNVTFTLRQLRSDLLWQAGNIEERNFTLVNLALSKDIFDWCDLSQYTPQGIQPLLAAHGIRETNSRYSTLIHFVTTNRHIYLHNMPT
jgi:hypothetical protein